MRFLALGPKLFDDFRRTLVQRGSRFGLFHGQSTIGRGDKERNEANVELDSMFLGDGEAIAECLTHLFDRGPCKSLLGSLGGTSDETACIDLLRGSRATLLPERHGRMIPAAGSGRARRLRQCRHEVVSHEYGRHPHSWSGPRRASPMTTRRHARPATRATTSPGGGDAPVAYDDVTADDSNDCYIDCSDGAFVPRGNDRSRRAHLRVGVGGEALGNAGPTQTIKLPSWQAFRSSSGDCDMGGWVVVDGPTVTLRPTAAPYRPCVG